MRVRGVAFTWLLLAVGVGPLAGAPPEQVGLGLDPARRISQHVLDAWTSEHGLPSNSLLYLHQTRDGYLWMSSFNGLVRFDGVRFSLHNSSTDDAFANNVVENLVEDHDGVLWVGVQGQGLVAYRNGVFHHDPATHGFAPYIKSLYVDEANVIWIGTQSDGAFSFDRSRFTPLAGGAVLRQTIVLAIRKTPDGVMHFATEGRGVVTCRDGVFAAVTGAEGLPSDLVNDLFVDRSGTLWASTNQGLASISRGRATAVPETLGFDTFHMVEDDAGMLWLAARGALFRIVPATRHVEAYTPQQGSPIHYAYQLCLDREGSLWISSYRGGLFRLRTGKVTPYTMTEGVRGKIINALCELGPDVFLVGSDEGTVDILDHGQGRPLKTKTSLSQSRIRDVFRDSRGVTWVGTYSGLLRIAPDGKEKLLSTATGFPDDRLRVAMEDRDGNVWFGTRNQGLVIMRPNGSTRRISAGDGLSSNFIMSLEQLASGDVLVGTSGGGLNVIRQDGGIEVHSPATDFPGDIVFRTTTGPDSVTWIAFNGGLARFKDGRFATFSVRQGLASDSPYDVLLDDFGALWCPTARGIMRLSRDELDAVADGRATHLHSELLGKADGMREAECTGTARALATSDGRLMFATLHGVVMVDPAHLPTNRVVPPVHITGLTVDGASVATNQAAPEVGPGARRFVLDYTALSLVAPSAVRFRFRLDGFDHDWVDAGAKRSAEYTNLSPGPYTFRVIACNNDGVWNERGAASSFRVRPFVYQTTWFQAGALLLLLAGVAAGVQARLRVLRRRQVELERIVAERTAEVRHQKDLIEAHHGKIRESISYAQRIQVAVLRPDRWLDEDHFFVLLRPRDVVSGDFFYIKERDGLLVLAVADCTGHGVPGAFMSLLGVSFLNQIVHGAEKLHASEVLEALRRRVKSSLKQTGAIEEPKDGMDIALVILDRSSGTAEYCGANNPLLLVRHGEIEELRPTRNPIGVHPWEKPFVSHHLALAQDDVLYLFSDGLADQPGGPQGERFKGRRLKELFLAVHRLPMRQQKQAILEAFESWRGEAEQVDDILIMGVRIDLANPVPVAEQG